MRECEQAQQSGWNTAEHHLTTSAECLEAGDEGTQAAAIDELKCCHIHDNTFVSMLRQVHEPGLKLWSNADVQASGRDFNDDNIASRLGCKGNRISSQERRGTLYLPPVLWHILSTTCGGNLSGMPE